MSTDDFGSIANTDRWRGRATSAVNYEEYDSFEKYYRDLADDIFPFPAYHDYQDEILYETLKAYLVDDYLNVVIEGPTGIGKSAINVTVAQVLGVIASQQEAIEAHFRISLRHLNDGSAFYTTPQKSLRNQLAEDEDLKNAVAMLKARRDYICEASGEDCAECPVNTDSDKSCRNRAGCTYWTNKMDAVEHHVAIITFAMLIVDQYLPPSDEAGRLSFEDRDLVIVDEGHSVEGQSASLFAGFELSPQRLPGEVYGDAGDKINWDDDRFGDVIPVIEEIMQRASKFIREHEDDDSMSTKVENCEALLRKIRYAYRSHNEGEGWVIDVEEAPRYRASGTTKMMAVQPVRVDDFLSEFIWSRGRRHLITSATIPFRNNISRWAERIGLDENVKFISKPTPFPVEHRLIHTNTMVGSMSSGEEDDNWPAAMDKLEEIASHHKGEKGLVHSVSYPRAKRLQKSLGEANVMIDKPDLDTSAVITKWQNSTKDILVSPAMTEGVDLHGDMCRWQVLLKVPFAYMGDSRVSYLLQEKNEWNWYMENAATDIIQSVGRAVRGPEPEEAASYYVLDEKFKSIIARTSPPEYFLNAVSGSAPDHWEDPSAAPWRDDDYEEGGNDVDRALENLKNIKKD